jgi:hypothetical protein
MSLFKTYTPRSLYSSTLRMINTMFVHPPKLDLAPTSYFKATIEAHKWIKTDLSETIPLEEAAEGETTIEQIFQSLVGIEKMLFGTQADFEVTIRGCCWYTESLEARLKPTYGCVVH